MKDNNLLPSTLTIIILAAAILLGVLIDEEKVSAYGSIIAASGSVIAILWFTIGLKKETNQQKIQNEQFRYSFQKIIEQGRREGLLLAKSILDDAENKVNTSNEFSLHNLFKDFLKPFDYNTLYSSINADRVSELAQEWIERIGPGYQFIRSIKAAATIYLKSIDAKNIDYLKEPEEFVFIYGPLFWSEPFFENYRVVGEILSELHFMIKPGTKGITIAALCAQSIRDGLPLKLDKIKDDIKHLIDTGNEVPEIAYVIFPDLRTEEDVQT